MRHKKNAKQSLFHYLLHSVDLVNPVKLLLVLLSFLFSFIVVTNVCADDVGITKARIIQQTENSYVLEADVIQALVWAIKEPIFPDRFQVSELEFIIQSGWIVVQATATTTGKPLSPEDELLLPWMRNGAAITVQWLDGSIHQGLFMRSLEGIHVPLRLLMPSSKPLGEVCIEHFRIGLGHLTFKWVHPLLVVILFLLSPSRQVFKYFLYYSFGQAFSLILSEMGLPGFDLLFADILGALLIFMLSFAVVRKQTAGPYLPLLFLFGLIHGLAYAQELVGLDLPLDQRIQALFMFNMAIDLGHFVIAILLLISANVLAKLPHLKKVVPYCSGALSIAIVLVLFQEHVIAGKTDVLHFSSVQSATQFSLPASQTTQAGGKRPAGARQLTSPVMSYLSVEPYEVRQEILIRARSAVQFLGVDEKGMGSIPVESLEPVKKGILSVFTKANPVSIDGQPAEPILSRADFVTLGPAGVILRPEPVPESLDEGIIGLTLVYETPDLADTITVDWRLFSDTVKKVEATTTDPFGGTTVILSPDDNRLEWKSRLSGYRVPVIEEVSVEKQKLPVVSGLLFLMALGLSLILFLKKRVVLGRPVLLSIVGLGFVLYPFYRFPVDLPLVSQWKPSTERTSTILESLLTNVYRAFDVRDENRVYDRLAMSVIGEQLSEIYLENRQSLEFENRGGARANVDEVEILFINTVKRSDDDAFIADTAWIVSGSVSHFGHTHYRRNRYHALVTFVTDNDAWKIKDIELIEEERLL